MKLIFINEVGSSWDDTMIYEFIFTDGDIERVDGYGWDEYPSSGRANGPDKAHISGVARIETDQFKLICVQNSSNHSVWDAVDGIIALAYEDITEYDEYPEPGTRLKFFYGDDYSKVKDCLYTKDINIEIKQIKK